MVIISRTEVHARLAKITVIPISSNDRGWPDEVRFDVGDAGLRMACVAQCRELAHIPRLCAAINAVIGC